jgi:hypothetical protein
LNSSTSNEDEKTWKLRSPERKLFIWIAHTIQMGVERAIADEFVDEKPALVLDAVADEHDQVAVLGAAQHFHFGAELDVALRASKPVLLHCHSLAVRKNTPVHASKPSFGEEVRSGKPCGCKLQLCI